MPCWHGSTLYALGTTTTRTGPGPTATADQGSRFGIHRLGSPSARMSRYATSHSTGRRDPRAGYSRPGSSPSNLMPRSGCAGRSLNRSGKPTERKPGARSGATQTARSPARDRWPDSVGHSSLGEAPDRPRGVTTRRPLRLDSDILAGRQLQQRARAPPSAHCPGSHGGDSDKEPQRTQRADVTTRTTSALNRTSWVDRSTRAPRDPWTRPLPTESRSSEHSGHRAGP
jgi:hypothetical protein